MYQVANRFVENELISVVEPLKECVLWTRSLNEALNRRKDLRNNYAFCKADLEAKQTSLSIAKGTSKENLETNKFDMAQTALKSSKDKYEQVTAKLQTEVQVFQTQQEKEITEILVKWTLINSHYCQLAQEKWDELRLKLTGQAGQAELTIGRCCICFSNASSVVILPCKHLCLCNECGNSGRFPDNGALCPICRVQISSKLRVYSV